MSAAATATATATAAATSALGGLAASAASSASEGVSAGLQRVAEGLASSGLNGVDAVLGFVLLASVLVGLVRGLVFEVLSLAGWVAAWLGAAWVAPLLAPHLPLGEPGAALRQGAAFVIAFIACLLAWSLAARLVRLLLHATPLSLPDRLLGAAFGLLRGGVLLLALATVVGFTPLSSSQPWRESRLALVVVAGLDALRPLLPPAWSTRLPRQALAPVPVAVPV